MNPVEGQRVSESDLLQDRSERHESRGMKSMANDPTRHQPLPEELKRETEVPKNWGEELDRQEDFIEELLGD